MKIRTTHTARHLIVALVAAAALCLASPTAEAASGTTQVSITLTPAAAELLSSSDSSSSETQAAHQLLKGSATVSKALRSSYSADQTREILNQLESHSILLLPEGVFRINSDGVTQDSPHDSGAVVTAYAL